MGGTLVRFLAPGGLFVVAVVTGVLVTRGGRPFNAGVFAVHKIAALAAAVLLSIAVVRLARQASLGTTDVAVLVAAGLIGLALLISGGWLSIKPAEGLVLAIHKVMPLLTVIAVAGAVALLAAAGR